MNLENIAWNNFCKTGDIQSFLEYKKIENMHDCYTEESITDKITRNIEVMINEVNKSQGDSNKRSSI